MSFLLFLNSLMQASDVRIDTIDIDIDTSDLRALNYNVSEQEKVRK